MALVDCLGLAVDNVALDKMGTVEKRALGFLELIALRERRVTPREVSMLKHSADTERMRKRSKTNLPTNFYPHQELGSSRS